MRIDTRNSFRTVGKLVKKNMGRISYYGAIALVLALVAYAAQDFRKADIVIEPQSVAVSAEEIKRQEPFFTPLDTGSILQEYNASPVWDHRLKYWHTHAAVDYACSDNQVLSLSDGEVHAIGKSGGLGGYIEIQTGEYLLRYASIEADDTIEVGEAVEKGAILGTADSCMPSEAHLGEHVHLELRLSDEPIDFLAQQDKMYTAE